MSTVGTVVAMAAVDLIGRAVEVMGFWPWVLDRFLGQRGVVVTLAAGLGVSVLVARPLALRFGVRPAVALLAAASCAVVVAVTVVPDEGYRAYAQADLAVPGWATWWRHGWSATPERIAHGIDGPFNVMLFVPAGALWAHVTGRPVVAWAALATSSLLVETTQSFTGLREASVDDVVANSLGAAVGVGLGIACSTWTSWSSAERRRRSAAERLSGSE